MAGHIDNFDCIGGVRGIRLELNLIDISFEVVALQNLTRTTFWIVIQTNALLLLNALFKCLVYLSALRNRDWTNTRVVVLDACECFSERSIALVVSLFKNLRSKVFLFFFVCVLSSNSVVGPRHASFGFPIRICAKSHLWQVVIIDDGCLFDVSTAKHARLKILVLALFAIKALRL